ncbi:MAG: phosphoadenylyl-sulfate reductase [Pseudomonadota bacterium]
MAHRSSIAATEPDQAQDTKQQPAPADGASVDGLAFRPHTEDAERLDARAKRLSAQFGSLTAEGVLDEAIHRQFPGRVALVSSFGAESATLLQLVAKIDPSTPVIFLETGKHFAQTLSYRRKLARRLGLTNVQDIAPNPEALKTQDPTGTLWRTSPDKCCTLRKVNPLSDALQGVDAWITGRKHFHGGARARLPVFEASAPHIKINPIARWTADDVSAYIKEHDLPPHPLVEQGYPSIGCWPCTHPSADADDPRAGRWRGAAKTECGIHASAAKDVD